MRDDPFWRNRAVNPDGTATGVPLFSPLYSYDGLTRAVRPATSANDVTILRCMNQLSLGPCRAAQPLTVAELFLQGLRDVRGTCCAGGRLGGESACYLPLARCSVSLPLIVCSVDPMSTSNRP